jgi:ATP-dependent DNA helicase RecQ
MVDGTIAAQKALSAIARTGQRFGTEHLVSLLLGEVTEGIEKFGHQRLPTFGVGQEFDRKEWRGVFRQLHGAGLLALDVTGFGGWSITEGGRAVLKGKDRFDLRADRLKAARATRKARDRSGQGVPSGDAGLLAALKQRRTEFAKAQGVPAYVIFADRSLEDMAARKPATLDNMRQVHGVGEAKLARYGAAFLDVIRTFEDR